MASLSDITLDEIARPRNLILIAVLIFVTVVVVLFPWDELEEATRTGVRQSTGAQFNLDEMGWALPVGLKAKGVTFSLGPADSAPLLRCETLRATPAWRQLLALRLAVDLTCVDGDGRLSATYVKDGDLNVTLRQWRTTLPLTQDGKTLADIQALSGEVRLLQQNRIWRPLSSNLTASRVELQTSLLPLDAPVALQQLQLVGEGTPETFRISRITSQGPLALNGEANIQWRGNSMRGNWDSRLVLTPATDLPQNLQQMLPLLGKRQPDGSYTLRHRTSFSLQ